MTTSKLIIYADQIKPAASIIGLIDGSEQFWFENPWFSVPGSKPVDKKTYLLPISDQSGSGAFLKSPKLLARTSAGGFTQNFSIGWTRPKVLKEYRVNSPHKSVKDIKQKTKLLVSPCDSNTPEDAAILTLAWKLNYVQDIVLIAHILDIDLAKYKGAPNDKFLPAFVEECNKILQAAGASKTIVLDSAYTADFEVPQILHNLDSDNSIFISELGSDQPSFKSVYQEFYESVKSIKTLKNRPKNKQYSCVWGRSGNGATPSVRWHSYIKAEDEEATPLKLFDSRVTFTLKLDPDDPQYNPRIPDFILTNNQVGKAKTIKLTKPALISLWGGTSWPSTAEKKESAIQSGCIFVRPAITYSYHAKGTPTVELQADTVVLHKVNKSADSVIEDAGGFFQSDDEFGEEQPPSNEPSQTVNTSGDIDPAAL